MRGTTPKSPTLRRWTHQEEGDTWPLVSQGKATLQRAVTCAALFFSAQDTRHEKALLFCSVSQNAFPEFLVCGVVPIFDDQKDWKLVSLYTLSSHQLQHTCIQCKICCVTFVGCTVL